MDHTTYLIGQLIIVLLSFGLLSMLIYGLRHALSRLRVKENRSRKLIFFVIAGLAIWLAILAVAAWSGFFREYGKTPPRIFFALFPPLLLIVLLMFSKKVRLFLLALPPQWLIYAQSFRILMELFLWFGYRGGYVPGLMTFEGLNYDIIVGLTAPMAGFVFFGSNRNYWYHAVLWNVFGIALLLNVVALGLMSLPEPSMLHVFDVVPASAFVSGFPFIWVPGFIVPFALALHLFSLKQLLLGKRRRRQFSLKKG